MSTITIDLDDDLLAHVRSLAKEFGFSVEEFVADIVATHAGPSPDLTSEQIAAIRAGLNDVEQGNVISHEDVMAQLDARYGR